MFGIESTAYDKKVYAEQLQDFLPDTLVDVHVHLWTPESRKGYVRSDNGIQFLWHERVRTSHACLLGASCPVYSWNGNCCNYFG